MKIFPFIITILLLSFSVTAQITENRELIAVQGTISQSINFFNQDTDLLANVSNPVGETFASIVEINSIDLIYTCNGQDADLDGVNCYADCDDEDKDVHPGAQEICNGIDDNCDGQVDETFPEQSNLIYCGTGACHHLAQPVCISGAVEYICNPVEGASQEVCGDGIDNDCDGVTDEDCYLETYYLDADGDGYGDLNSSVVDYSPPAGYVDNSLDCDDANQFIHPGATEFCDGIDNDCDGLWDNACIQGPYYLDGDGDGYGDPTNSIVAPTLPVGYVTNSLDCDDSNPNIYPGAQEICDGIDNNCNATIDESFPEQSTQVNCGIGQCYNQGYIGCIQGALETICDPGMPSQEICGDGIDNDCDGVVDDGCVLNTYYKDLDHDGYGNPNITIQDYSQPFGYSINSLDCNDLSALVHPGAQERCNGQDDDCDGLIDEDFPQLGEAVAVGVGECQRIGMRVCSQDGFGTIISVTPGDPSFEICGDGLDNDCDGIIDNGCVLNTYYLDADMDGYGDANSTIQGYTLPTGYTTNSTDCDDSNPNIHPGAQEICDGIDNDCDGLVDVADPSCITNTFYLDADGDGYGDFSNTIQDCTVPAGYSINSTDCDDTDPNVNPGMPETTCNNKDDDCNSLTKDDNLAPYPNVVNLPNILGECIVNEPVAPTAADDCAGIITGVTSTPFPVTTIGVTPITWVYDDGNGHIATQNQYVVVSDMNATIIVNQNELIASPSGANYQWINCSDNSAIPGEIYQFYLVEENGSYAVIVDDNGCVDTSNCVTINSVGMDGLSLESFKIFPNPTMDGFFNIKCDGNIDSIEIFDMLGQKMDVSKNTVTKFIDGSKLVGGRYIVSVGIGDLTIKRMIVILR